jgi:uncharacterized SAM-binding protein YcdF (DUF218 family)
LKKIAYGMLMLIGVAAMIDAYILSFTASVYNFGTWFPGLVGLLLICLSAGKLTGRADKLLGRHRRVVKFAQLGLIIWGISFIVVEGYILLPNDSQKCENPDYVVILGAGLNGDKLSWLLSERMATALEYLQAHPDTKAVVSGGQGPDEAVAEGTAMQDYLVQNGIEPSRIIVEDKAKSTLENFKFTKALLPAKRHKILVITSDFHMRRAIMLAERTGFAAGGLCSKTPDCIVLNCYLREYFALLKSYVADRGI